MGQLSFAFTAPLLSMVSPNTLNKRPKLPCPTGTDIGAPVFSTSAPRTNPSVDVMATVRTSDPPKCCSTSSTTSVRSLFYTFNTVYTGGTSPSENTTSTTGPIICVIIPFIKYGAILITNDIQIY